MITPDMKFSHIARQVAAQYPRIGAASSRPYAVKYYMSWETSDGKDMDVNHPEYDELAAFGETMNASLQSTGIETDWEPGSITMYVDNADGVVKAITAMEAELTKGDTGQSPVIQHNTQESHLLSVEDA